MQAKKNNRFYETDSFKELNSQWQTKLKDSGFQDIEEHTEPHHQHIYGPGFSTRSNRFKTKESTEEYVACIDSFINRDKFNSELEKTIIILHADGVSSIEIGKKLNKSRFCIYYHIKAVTKRIGLKNGKR